MKKTIYSLVLEESVVGLIDERAKAEGVSRSTLVNRILGEYVGLSGAFSGFIDEAARLTSEKKRFSVTKKDGAFTAVSSIYYKYAPKITYSVTCCQSKVELSVFVRSTSDCLIGLVDSFFEALKESDKQGYNSFVCEGRGRYSRNFTPSGENAAKRLADYLESINKLMSNFVSDFPGRREEKLYSAISALKRESEE